MAVETTSGTADCPECFDGIAPKDVMQSEIVQCSECGVELEVRQLSPLELELAPAEEEDWGE